MKKSDKQFSVTVNNGAPNNVGTRSGVANFVRKALENVEVGDSVTFTVNISAAPEEKIVQVTGGV